MTSFGTRATAFEDRSDMGSSFSKINSVSAVLERERERERERPVSAVPIPFAFLAGGMTYRQFG